jgi:hypothetical protein
MIGSSYDEFSPYDWDSGYKQAIKDITKHIQEKKEYYSHGEMCSMSESVVGECVCDDILKYLDELRKKV